MSAYCARFVLCSPSYHKRRRRHPPHQLLTRCRLRVSFPMPTSKLRYYECNVLRGHTGGIVAMAFSPDGNYLATAGTDRRLCIWNVKNGSQLHSLSANLSIFSLAWLSPPCRAVFCGAEDGSIFLLRIGEVNHRIPLNARLLKTSLTEVR